jgi:hypothetical protein
VNYLKKAIMQPFTDPFGRPPPFPFHQRPLTPEEDASPYRAPPRLFDVAPMMDNVVEAYKKNGSVLDDALAKFTVHGFSAVTQALRGIGDIVNAIRGTKYPPYVPAPQSPRSTDLEM